MNRITNSLVCPRRGARERVQDLLLSPFELNRRQISLPSAPTGRRRLSVLTACFMSPKFSLIRSCGSTPRFNTVPSPTPLPPCRAPILFPSDFRRPYSLGAGHSTHTGIEVSHSPLSTLFCNPLNSSKAPDSTSSIDVMLQERKSTCTRLCILSP